MGQEFPYKKFSSADFKRFKQCLLEETTQLKQVFESQSLEVTTHYGGFELEAWLVDKQAKPLAENEVFLKQIKNPEVVPELSLFNIEINVEPLMLQKGVLKAFEYNLNKNWMDCRRVALENDMDVMAIGVHPTIKDEQLTLANMSKSDRYKALNEQTLAMRNEQPMVLDIQGREHLHAEHSDVMLEAAATSFQIHHQVNQAQAVRAYNAAQIISAPLVALSANSPYLFGKSLWAESRIPIFEQAVDMAGNGAQRVGFGSGYIQSSLMECFEDNVTDYPVMIPAKLDSSFGPLSHLRLHNGTIWRWNRPLVGFNEAGDAHVRIENRVVAAGPTIKDMIANAAFFWGVVEAMINEPIASEEQLPFKRAKTNFYEACRTGLDCECIWLDGKTYQIADLILSILLPLAVKGLTLLNIDSADIDEYLGIIKARVSTKQNGAAWQRAWVNKYGKDMQGLSLAYLNKQNTGQPVHEWTI